MQLALKDDFGYADLAAFCDDGSTDSHILADCISLTKSRVKRETKSLVMTSVKSRGSGFC